jgi:Domain of unknown function (DUF4262)
MTESISSERKKALALIKRNIEKSGFHIYIVSGNGPTPRFAYTIGLRESLGAELVFAGGFFYEKSEQILKILHSLRKQLAGGLNDKLGPIWQSEFIVPKIGKFTLRRAHPSWARSLLLGALDYYSIEDIDAYQIVPQTQHRTIDVPNMSAEWSTTAEPVWRWREDEWPYPISPDSEVMTNLDALRGEPITEVVRFEERYWEMYAGASGPDVPEDEARLIPLGCLLAFDPSLMPIVDLAIGEGIWRDDASSEWSVMQSPTPDD